MQAMVNKAYSNIEPEPPPLQEDHTSPTAEEKQWTDDIQHMATTETTMLTEANNAINDSSAYTPFIRKLQSRIDIRNQLLRAQHSTQKVNLPPPNNHPLYIPTPKSHPHTNVIDSTNTLHQTT